MSYLGIDIGTTGVKAVAFDEKGGMLASAYLEYQTISPCPGWYELDSNELIKACKQVLKKTASQVRSADPVKAIGISSQAEAFTILDKGDNYLCNVMVSFDNRSQNQVEEFTSEFGAEKLYNITGHSSHTIFSLFKLLWIKENRIDIFKKMKRIHCCADLLAYELTGNAAISYNLASRTMLLDVQNLTWSREILEQIGIDNDVLPKLVASCQTVGTLKPRIAEQLCLEADVIVAAGGHDQSCGALGAGVAESETAAYSIGTVECVTPFFSKCIINETMRKSNLATYPATIDGLYTTVAFNLIGGNLLRWYRDTFGDYERMLAEKQNSDAYDLLLKEIPPAPTDIFILPYFASTGTPYFDSNPTSAIIGLTLNSKKADITKAVIEGVTYEMKLNMELLKSAGINVQKLCAFGGGAKSDKSLQIKSDILGVPIDILETTEAGCLGAGLLAAKARGDVSSLKDTAKLWSSPAKTFEPQIDKTERYEERFEIYSRIYETLKPLGTKINSLKN